ncbi:MAG: PAS domain S-box protein [Bacteroidota bacterium]
MDLAPVQDNQQLQNQRHRLMMEEASDGIFVMDYDGRYIDVNKSGCYLLGYSREEILGMTAYEILPDGVPPLVKKKNAELQAGQALISERMLRKKDGSYLLVEVSYKMLPDGYVMGITRDITERKRIEQQLKESQDSYVSLVNNIDGIVWEADARTFRFSFVSQQAERLLGYPVQQWIDDAGFWASHIVDEDRDYAVNYCVNCTREKKNHEFEYRMRAADGTVVWLRDIVSVVLENNEPLRLRGIMVDITEKKKAEEKIKRREAQLLASVQNTPNVAVQWYNTKGEVLFWNHASELMFGWQAREAMGKTLDQLIHTPEEAGEFVNTLRHIDQTGERAGPAEFQFRRRDGSAGYCISTIFKIPSLDEDPYFVCMDVDITESKVAAKALQESEEKHRDFYENSMDGIMLTGLKGEILAANTAACTIFGMTEKEICDAGRFGLVDATDPRLKQLLDERSKTGKAKGELTLIRGNGEKFEAEISSAVFTDTQGEMRASMIIRDITERKKAEEKVRESEERYRALVENAVEALVVFDVEKRQFVSVSESAVGLFKMSREELLKIGPVEVSPEFQPDGRRSSESAMGKITKAIEGEKPSFEWTHCDARGNPVLCEVRLVRLPAEGQILIRGSIIDITERKKIEKAIATSEETRRLIMNSALDAIVCIDRQGIINVWTPQAEKIFGWTEQEALGKPLTETIIPERYRDKHIQGIRHYHATGEGPALNRIIEISAVKKNGEEFPVELSITPVKQGETEFFCAFIRDITERKEAAAKIVKEKELSDTAINSLPGIFYMLDIDRKFLRWNKNFETVSGYSPEEIAEIIPALLFAEEDRLTVRQKVGEIFEKGSAELEARFLTKKGEKIPYFLTGQAITYEGRRCMLGTGIDIALLKKVQEDYSLVVNTVDGIVWEADARTFQFSFVSMQAERLLGYPVDRWTNEPSFWADHIHPEDRSWAVEYCVTCTTEMKPHEFEYRMIAEDGRVVWLRDIVSVTVENGKPVRLRGIMIDITEKKKGEIALKQSEEKLRHILSSTADDFYVIDKDYRVVLINASAKINLEVFWDKKISTGDNILDIIPLHVRESIKRNYDRVFAGERIEYEFINRINGEIFWRWVNYGPVRDEHGFITGAHITTKDITEKKKTEEEVIKTNARFQVMSKATSDIIWDWDLQDNSLWWNDNYYSNLGYEKEKEIVDIENWYSHIHPADFDRVKANILTSLAGNDSVWRDEYRYRKSDGTYLDILDRGYIMRNHESKAYRMIGSMVDMTPIYNVQKKVAESENRLRTILDTDPECIKLLDADCILLDINKAGLEMIEGDSLEKVRGSSILSVVADAQKEQAAELVRNTFKGMSGRLEFEMIGLKGAHKWCEVNVVPFRNADSKIISALGVTRDVTEKKRAEIELVRNEEKYRTLVEQAVDAIALYDATGRLLDVNTGSVNLLGYSKEELVGMSMKEILTEEEIRSNPVRFDILEEGMSTVKQRRMRRKDGTVIETEVRSQKLPDGRFLSVARDLTERIQAERELAASYEAIRKLTGHIQDVREEERTSIAREIHDELGQQLTVLKMDISWLKKKINGTDETVKQKIKDLLSMLDETVKTVRRISSELRPSLLDDLGLLPAMEWHLKEFEQRSGLKTVLKTAGPAIELPDNIKTGLYRIFQESLTNVARHAAAKKVEVVLENSDGEIRMRIADNGKGFDKTMTDNKRTLGILGMKERTAMMGGTYEIESKPGKGTTVIVKVTVQDQPVRQ